MEDVLDVYERPYDPRRPVVCLDETSKQLVAETRRPVPMARGRPARFDYEYARRGPVRWRFTTADTRIKLARLYPALHE